MAWILGICLGAVIVGLGVWALLDSASQADDYIDNLLAEADGSELDLPQASQAVPRFDQTIHREAVAGALPTLWPDPPAAHRRHDCTAGAECLHQDRPIVVGYTAWNVPIEYSEQGLISSIDGWRHTGCPDLRLRELTAGEATDALSRKFTELIGK